MAAVGAALERAGAAAGDVERVRARDDRRDERAARGPRRAHRARRDRGLHRRRRARPPGARRPLPPVRRAAGAARAARAARRARPSACGPDGVLRALEDPAALADAVAALEPEAVAVVLLHAYAHPSHERAIGDGARRARCPTSTSRSRTRSSARFASTSAPRRPRSTPRCRRCWRATCAGCSSAPPTAGLPEPRIMQSSGGLAAAELAARHAAFTVLSGPGRRRGGGGARRARAAAAPDLVCFDMGGTSCDVCVVEGGAVRETAGPRGRRAAARAARWSTSTRSARAAARSPGAIRAARCASARAARAPMPGPACYGRGGEEPTVTDANLLLGRLGRRRAAGRRRRAGPRRRRSGRSARSPTQLGLDPLACAEGIVRVANAEMVRALRVMTVEQGIDPRRFALLAFGGAGPLHAAAIADELGMTTILCPRASGVLSALGLAAADRRATEQRTVLLAGDALTDDALARGARRAGRRRARARRSARRGDGGDVEVEVAYDVRYRGQAHELTVRDLRRRRPSRALRDAFEDLHEERYGYRDADAPIEVVTIRATASVAGPAARPRGGRRGAATRALAPRRSSSTARSTTPRSCAASRRRASGSTGPAICELPEATLAVPPGWSGTRRRRRHDRARARASGRA